MTDVDPEAVHEQYAEHRERDWNSFVTGTGSLPDYWSVWEERSFGWRVPIEFLQPLGLESPDTFANLEPLLDVLRGMPEVDIVPTEWLHMTWVRVGFLMSTDIMWSQVESFYVNAAPRLRRIEPFTLKLKGVSVGDGERIYLGVEDAGTYREARRLAKLGVPKVWEVLKQDPLIDAGGNDSFVPVVDIAYFTGKGDRQRVIDALEPFRDLEVGEISLTHLKLARIPILPHSHYEMIDVVAEIPMLGAAHRGGVPQLTTTSPYVSGAPSPGDAARPERIEKPKSVLIIGSGPIVIGQAAEFDYAGTQACKAMREEGIRSILVNSNPATIMTDEGIADVVYIEPLTVEVLERIIAREQPDALLPTLGGQTGLNLAVDLAEAGILDKYNVRLLGSSVRTIKLAEDREMFRDLLRELGEPVPPSEVVETWEQAQAALDVVGLPAIIRPAYTLGGTGGGIARTMEDYERICKGGLAASPIHQILVEQSLLGWKELEYEVMRDGNDTCITICNMENLDPMGVHTGDSIVVAPSQTLADREYHMLRNSALKIIRALGIEGGCNVQFALAPRPDVVDWDESDEAAVLPYHVIEVNPRVSRSSALASKATGYPIARVAAKIAIGKYLHEIENSVTRRTTAAFEPALDYVVVKIPRWPFDKFATGDRQLGTQMKATGEVMAIDRTWEGALQKAIRSLEFGQRSILWQHPDWGDEPPLDATDERIWALLASVRRGIPLAEISRRSGVDPWFVERLARIVEMEKRLLAEDLTPALLRQAKRLGFADRDIATLADRLPTQVRALRDDWDIRPVYKMVDTCAAEFDAVTPYFYSSYEQENEAPPTGRQGMLVIGSGPIRIGQGIEFDYCSVRAAKALQEAGVESIMANSNPETVSTDFDTSDRLYFEPLDEESLRDLLENEAGDQGEAPPSIVQFGGQTAVNMARPLHNAALPIAGSSADAIDIAEDRGRFGTLLAELDIPQPPGAAVTTLEDALSTAQAIGYPVLVRPSYVLGGRAMEVVQDANELVRYFGAALAENTGSVLIDKFLVGPEVEVDAICDGERVLIPGIMEHIERAGVHSGDSMAVYPPQNLTDAQRAALVEYTTKMALGLGVRGLMNVQFVIAPDSDPTGPGVFVIEVNPRSSRTVPFLSKVTGVPMVTLSVNIMLGKTLAEQGYEGGLWPERNLVAVKAPVFSMQKLADVDTFLGPEMKSTGEVMGVDRTFEPAVRKAMIASGLEVKPGTGFLLSISNQTKSQATPLIRLLHETGCPLFATEGTAALIEQLGIPVHMVTKRLSEGHPNVVDVIRDGTVGAVINTIEGGRAEVRRDGFHIRRAATEMRIPCFTSMDTAAAAINALAQTGDYEVAPLLEYRDGASV